MSLGPGKFDDLLTVAREAALKRDPRIHGAILIVVGPPDVACSGGFEVQLTQAATLQLPHFLRMIVPT